MVEQQGQAVLVAQELRAGGAGRGQEAAGGISREHPTLCGAGMPKREASGVAACSLSSYVLVRVLHLAGSV